MTYRIAPKASPWKRMLTRLERKASINKTPAGAGGGFGG
jgi:hypothetical protein